MLLSLPAGNHEPDRFYHLFPGAPIAADTENATHRRRVVAGLRERLYTDDGLAGADRLHRPLERHAVQAGELVALLVQRDQLELLGRLLHVDLARRGGDQQRLGRVDDDVTAQHGAALWWTIWRYNSHSH